VTVIAGRLASHLGFRGDFLFALGKDYPHKDHATLFRALARLPQQVRLCVAGTKIWRNAGETSDQIIDRLGLGERVRWVQGLDDQDIKALIQGCRAMVFPSLEEGFGLPPIEAMALGTLVVAAAAMSIPEVCGDGAWLFPPGDDVELERRLRAVLAGGAEVATQIARGRRREQEYSWQRTARLTFACYERAVATARAGNGQRRPLDQRVTESLAIAARYRFNDAERELSAWQQRCHGAEDQLRRAHQRVQQLEATLLELDQQVPPPPELPRRPRWSLQRRIRKIRDSLRRRSDP